MWQLGTSCCDQVWLWISPLIAAKVKSIWLLTSMQPRENKNVLRIRRHKDDVATVSGRYDSSRILKSFHVALSVTNKVNHTPSDSSWKTSSRPYSLMFFSSDDGIWKSSEGADQPRRQTPPDDFTWTERLEAQTYFNIGKAEESLIAFTYSICTCTPTGITESKFKV